MVNENTLRNKIYTIRGRRVMLDADLAEIYGYETRYLNRQVKNNIEKFEGEDFMFQLNKEENDLVGLMCKNCTSKNDTGRGGNRKPSYAFTEQGTKRIGKEINNTVKKTDISPILLDFDKVREQREFISLNGEPARASEAFIDFYAKAEHTIYIIDNYIDIKTLRHLQKVKPGVKITIFSDNLKNYLHKSDYLNFQRERSGIKIEFKRTKQN